MAEWGKGDPRWIVEKREDGKNINSWHWEEKDCTKWCREHLEELVKDDRIADGANSIVLNKVTKMEGDVNWYNRKGKLFTLYDLELGLDYAGTQGEDAISGTIKIVDFEQDGEDKATFRVSVGSGPATDEWKKWAREAVKKRFLEIWSRCIVDLHADQKSRAPATAKTTSSVKLPDLVQKTPPAERNTATSANGVGATSTIKVSHVFQASPQDLWDLFVNPRKMEHFTQARVMVDPKEGGFFQLYDGVITGCFTELKGYTQMSFAWRLRDWKEGHNSQVTINFVKSSGGTKFELTQSGVPSNDAERTKQGWKTYYFERWRGVFGYSYE